MAIILENPKPVEQQTGILCLVLNILIPGLGIVIYNVTAKDDKWVRPFVEFFLAWLVIPWIVAIIDGVKIMQASTPPAQKAPAVADQRAR